MLRNGTAASQVYAAQGVGNLACNKRGQEEVHKAGGVRCLLALLGSGRAQEYALRSLHEHHI
jgi:hypothetical protein